MTKKTRTLFGILIIVFILGGIIGGKTSNDGETDQTTPTVEIAIIEETEEATGIIDLLLEDGSLPTTLEELPPGVTGYYLPSKKLTVCFDPETCLHEIGHQVDDEKRKEPSIEIFFSETSEWEAVVDYYRAELFVTTGDPDLIEDRINDFPGIGDNPCDTTWGGCYGGYVELYASILQHSKGLSENMPEIFRKFYDWERIWELEKDYPEIEEWKNIHEFVTFVPEECVDSFDTSACLDASILPITLWQTPNESGETGNYVYHLDHCKLLDKAISAEGIEKVLLECPNGIGWTTKETVYHG